MSPSELLIDRVADLPDELQAAPIGYRSGSKEYHRSGPGAISADDERLHIAGTEVNVPNGLNRNPKPAIPLEL
jgi:hypothetical protein